ncbi:hypothetical protein NDU88_001715 [Pleurodeles waltl]|uniref:Uncharacterized protein n=1 Tax=Pleurodeles waltl TaxID=8319 RepID=A0AAV7SAV7_PLEWA|nr:hypothetical protein NDU88_001715 [Pleurodeles waltl]
MLASCLGLQGIGIDDAAIGGVLVSLLVEVLVVPVVVSIGCFGCDCPGACHCVPGGTPVWRDDRLECGPLAASADVAELRGLADCGVGRENEVRPAEGKIHVRMLWQPRTRPRGPSMLAGPTVESARHINGPPCCSGIRGARTGCLNTEEVISARVAHTAQGPPQEQRQQNYGEVPLQTCWSAYYHGAYFTLADGCLRENRSPPPKTHWQ